MRLRSKIITVLASTALVLGSAVPASAVTQSSSARHYNFTSGAYSYIYSHHNRVRPLVLPNGGINIDGVYYCYEYHNQKLGGIGPNKLVKTGTHKC